MLLVTLNVAYIVTNLSISHRLWTITRYCRHIWYSIFLTAIYCAFSFQVRFQTPMSISNISKYTIRYGIINLLNNKHACKCILYKYLFCTRFTWYMGAPRYMYWRSSIKFNVLSYIGKRTKSSNLEWIDNFIPYFIKYMITYPFWVSSPSMLIKGPCGLIHKLPQFVHFLYSGNWQNITYLHIYVHIWQMSPQLG